MLLKSIFAGLVTALLAQRASALSCCCRLRTDDLVQQCNPGWSADGDSPTCGLVCQNTKVSAGACYDGYCTG